MNPKPSIWGLKRACAGGPKEQTLYGLCLMHLSANIFIIYYYYFIFIS